MLICNIYRVFERIIAEQLLFYLKSNKLITKYQYGFFEKGSTECHTFWSYEFIIDIIYFNFAKAFDTVSHSKLLTKLQSYGIKC